ncbi:MAG: hypothetical protein LW630_08680 [Saprospiraceae bacterium]|jgi:hypothetical protein|nr:hypothetical protein [Saprospiraceae bacterium]
MLRFFAQWYFRKSLPFKSKRQPKHTTNPGKSILILFDGTTTENRDMIAGFVKKVQSSASKEIRCLAYAHQKESVQDERFATFSRKEVNWAGVPHSEEISHFVSLNADILLVFCTQLFPPLEYITASSHAEFIIGPDIGNLDHYCHLLADVGSTPTFTHVVSQVLKSLDIAAHKS